MNIHMLLLPAENHLKLVKVNGNTVRGRSSYEEELVSNCNESFSKRKEFAPLGLLLKEEFEPLYSISLDDRVNFSRETIAILFLSPFSRERTNYPRSIKKN